MCTVTYLPLPGKSWLLTSNRDESPLRPTAAPAIHNSVDGPTLLYPQDILAGGTWIAVEASGKAGCVLNGAFVRHDHHPPYRKSRGLIMLALLQANDTANFFYNFDFAGIEPFTMVVIDNGVLFDLRWDGHQRYLSQPDATKPQLWASASLYEPEWHTKRHEWFNQWLKDHPIWTRNSILDFHLHAGEGNKMNDLVMNRYDMVCTVSITSIEKKDGVISMLYHDLQRGQEFIAGFQH